MFEGNALLQLVARLVAVFIGRGETERLTGAILTDNDGNVLMDNDGNVLTEN